MEMTAGNDFFFKDPRLESAWIRFRLGFGNALVQPRERPTGQQGWTKFYITTHHVSYIDPCTHLVLVKIMRLLGYRKRDSPSAKKNIFRFSKPSNTKWYFVAASHELGLGFPPTPWVES